VRQRLERPLREALRARDMIAVSALRSALAAIDDAGAIPAGTARAAGAGSRQFAGSAAGLGAGEAKRRSLSEAEVEKIVRAVVTGRRAAAREYERAGHADQADRLRRWACVLESAVDASEGRWGGP
jgi:uncharacterized protein YqeY